MKALLAKLKREPVRAYIYSAVAPVCGLLVARGLIVGSDVPLLEALATALLAIPAAERVRSRVTPVTKPEDEPHD